MHYITFSRALSPFSYGNLIRQEYEQKKMTIFFAIWDMFCVPFADLFSVVVAAITRFQWKKKRVYSIFLVRAISKKKWYV